MDTVFFIASKLIGALLRPDTWIVIALAVLVLALALHRRRLAIWLGSTLLGAMVTFSVLPLGDLLLQPIERSYPAEPVLDRVDGIIVLGGGEDARASAYWGQMQLNAGAERYTAALELARRFPEARLLFTGGSGALRDLAGAEVSEGAMAERFFLGLGVAPERLLIEDRSRNTAENAHLSLALANPDPSETWVLVTSAFHMPRAMRSFEAAGWAGVTPWPVDYRTAAFLDRIGWNLTRNLQVLNIAIREQVGRLAYRVSGR
ncbi:MAG: YdcF family protein [Natronohydrobacter sp.]|nr:YdcF family protein [Natronohydrobacter sp.]TVR44874.1 MAG: YdcF family protein [Paracoccaceae bacterium]